MMVMTMTLRMEVLEDLEALGTYPMLLMGGL